jgi:hypothetical protein
MENLKYLGLYQLSDGTYYEHHFMAGSSCYGITIEEPSQEPNLEELHLLITSKFMSAREFNTIEIVSILYDGEREGDIYVAIPKDDYPALRAAGVSFYCDYMDQGFSRISGSGSPNSDSDSDSDLDIMWADDGDKFMSCYGGELPFVLLTDLNSITGKDYKHYSVNYNILPISA